MQRLRDLPSELQPPFDWAEFRRRADERRRRGVSSSAWRYAAAAACLALLAIAVGETWSRLTERAAAETPLAGDATPAAPAASDTASDTPAVFAQADALEKWLASLPPEPVVMRVGTRDAVTELEDRIAWLDDLLTSQRLEQTPDARLDVLRRERARLVRSLATVRYAETMAAELP